MDNEAWQIVLISALFANALLGLVYRVYRRKKGGPVADVWGQAVLGFLLVVLAIGIAIDVAWLRWPALVYAAVFALLAMPIWVLGVLLPLRPRSIDYAFTAVYWLLLFVIGIGAVVVG